MDLEEAIGLKEQAGKILELAKKQAFDDRPSDFSLKSGYYFSPFIGIAATGKGSYQLEMRIASPSDRKLVNRVEQKTGQKVNYQIIKPIIPYSQGSLTSPCNIPLIGSTVSYGNHPPQNPRRGTLGCFVSKLGCSELLVLSNNHVLANLNQAQENDPIFFWEKQKQSFWQFWQRQPNYASPRHVASLLEFAPLKEDEDDCIDAAIAKVIDSNGIESNEIDGLGRLKGFRNESEIADDWTVFKSGSKTGLTRGKIRLSRIEQFELEYGEEPNRFVCKFKNVIEIRGTVLNPFSAPGDSGSIIVDEDCHALALLFAGTTDRKKTYAIPISKVFYKLGVKPAFLL